MGAGNSRKKRTSPSLTASPRSSPLSFEGGREGTDPICLLPEELQRLVFRYAVTGPVPAPPPPPAAATPSQLTLANTPVLHPEKGEEVADYALLLKSFPLVCKAWFRMFQNQELFREICLREGYYYPYEQPPTDWIVYYRFCSNYCASFPFDTLERVTPKGYEGTDEHIELPGCGVKMTMARGFYSYNAKIPFEPSEENTPRHPSILHLFNRGHITLRFPNKKNPKYPSVVYGSYFSPKFEHVSLLDISLSKNPVFLDYLKDEKVIAAIAHSLLSAVTEFVKSGVPVPFIKPELVVLTSTGQPVLAWRPRVVQTHSSYYTGSTGSSYYTGSFEGSPILLDPNVPFDGSGDSEQFRASFAQMRQSYIQQLRALLIFLLAAGHQVKEFTQLLQRDSTDETQAIDLFNTFALTCPMSEIVKSLRLSNYLSEFLSALEEAEKKEFSASTSLSISVVDNLRLHTFTTERSFPAIKALFSQVAALANEVKETNDSPSLNTILRYGPLSCISVPPTTTIGCPISMSRVQNSARTPTPLDAAMALHDKMFIDHSLKGFEAEVDLDGTPRGFELCPDFLSSSEESLLLAEIDRGTWINDNEGKRVQVFGYNYLFPSTTALDIPTAFQPLLEKLLARGLGDFDQMIVSEYAPGKELVGHVDRLFWAETIVGISCLAKCDMTLRSVDGTLTKTVSLAPRSMYVLRGSARYAFLHSIPGSSIEERRISLTFRSMAKGPVGPPPLASMAFT
eukprot:TRINITY_DN176_c9_g1_i1.p1 TRINITY_DN176_c9_g1~~TRINITY_DN176_c9_g1_i1.p1  ORF type:complete len:745 (+),score=115.24 TRINITY_DN176_c9_g1_i1:22-2235(+)